MKEQDVRQLLYDTEIARIMADDPSTRVVDEMVVLRGGARVDVAVVNSALSGYEIKSAADNLDRLSGQQAAYARVFDRMTLVAAERHVEEAVRMVPPCWGLIAVGLKDGKPHADEIWPARRNHEVDKLALAQLLWRDEAIELLEFFGLARGMRDKPRRALWQRLARELTVEELKGYVCYKLRTRQDWRDEGRRRA